jgi:lipopolysaccharide transport system ATP-binding protein
MSDIVIRVENISKEYRLGTISHGTLYRDLQSWTARLMGREDPNTEISTTGSRVRSGIFKALDDVSFDVRQGDVLGVIGRNGAGKSTLLKIISQVTAPTSGTIKIRGRVASLLEVGTGFHPELTGRENIFLNGAILGMTRREITSKFDEIVDFAEIEEFIDTPVKRYSSGMYVRLAFAVAAHLEPEILVIDEVLAVGDALFQKKCLGKMEAVGKEGRTVLFVSHNMGAVNRLCTKGIFLDHGKLCVTGLADDVLRAYMSVGMSDATIFELPRKSLQDMSLRRVILNPDLADRTNHLRYDRPIVVRIEYEVLASVDNCSVWIALQTVEGTMAFCSADYDMNHDLLGSREPGSYQADIRIPEKWLNVGEYSLIVGLVRNHPLIVYHREDTLSFRIEEVGTPASIVKEGVRRGVFQPFLPWETRKLG